MSANASSAQRLARCSGGFPRITPNDACRTAAWPRPILRRLNGEHLSRRIALTGVLLWKTNCTHRPAQPPFALKPVGSNVWAAIDNPHAQASAGSNAGFVIGDDVVVIDTHTAPGGAAICTLVVYSRGERHAVPNKAALILTESAALTTTQRKYTAVLNSSR